MSGQDVCKWRSGCAWAMRTIFNYSFADIAQVMKLTKEEARRYVAKHDYKMRKLIGGAK